MLPDESQPQFRGALKRHTDEVIDAYAHPTSAQLTGQLPLAVVARRRRPLVRVGPMDRVVVERRQTMK